MRLKNIRATKTGYTTFGCMWQQGECLLKDGEDISNKFVLSSALSKDIVMQSRITAYWPDGSVKWSAHTADAELLNDECEVNLRKGEANSDSERLTVREENGVILISNGHLSISIDKPTNNKKTFSMFSKVMYEDELIWENAKAVLDIDEPLCGEEGFRVKHYFGTIEKITVESEGPVEAIVKYEGIHEDNACNRLYPFVIRMHVGVNLNDIRFEHTFMVDGDEDKVFLKGIGIRFSLVNSGDLYNRHVKFMNETGMFHEALVHLQSWRPRIPVEYYKNQIAGEVINPVSEHKEILDKVLEATPYWDEYDLCQDSDRHFAIKKKLSGSHLCYVDAYHGGRTKGGAAFGSLAGSTIFASKDFWEKYPSGINFKNMTSEKTEATVWFWSPKAEHMDFRHYADRGYNQVCYEGYDYKGASSIGIANTNECLITYRKEMIPSDEDIQAVTEALNSPALFVASPKDYHDLRAFGYWSLPSMETETDRYLEEELSKAFEFYKNEVNERSWYGLFNYGDVMHSYDSVRHNWKYDVGGYAWDNTELVPTLWLWLYFLRTGREDVFTFAEKMSRHASEVDVYHFGKYKGLGSRHNVRHWGCPCKEARIAMAHHHRYLYYLTGDRRLEDIFDELKDNELSFLNKDPLGDFYDKADMVYPSHARSGPDWSSLVSNWMTEWERHNDNHYRDKIKIGLEDINNAPFKLSSGPDFEFDPHTVHLRYIGERTTGGCHLQICMGAPSIWLETADLLEDENFKKMIADHGRFYFLPHDEQLKLTDGAIGNRQSTLPMLATSMGAYGAAYLKDEWLSKKIWHVLLETMVTKEEATGFTPKMVVNTTIKEIPWITTNFTAQWCLNVIMVKEFIEDSMPKTIAEVKALVADANIATLHTS